MMLIVIKFLRYTVTGSLKADLHGTIVVSDL